MVAVFEINLAVLCGCPLSTPQLMILSSWSELDGFTPNLNSEIPDRVHPNVSVVDLVVKVSKKCTAEDVNAAVKAAADGPMKGIINFEQQPLVSSDFMQTDYSNSVDSALTMVMGEDLVKVVMWYDNEWGYSQRVLDLTAIVAAKLPVAA